MEILKEKYFTENQEKLSRFAKALSHPVRIFILEYLTNNLNKCCYSGDMAEELPIARSTLSEHLKELKKAGLIQGEINPPYIKYCINRDTWEEAKEIMNHFFDQNIENKPVSGACINSNQRSAISKEKSNQRSAISKEKEIQT